jgi:DNA-binding beta-propeller fold protein YncE
MQRTPKLALALLLAAVPALRAQAAPQAGYHVTRSVAVGGDGGWDYLTVDTAGNRLFLSRGTHVMVLDLARLAVVGDVPGTTGVHGIALDGADGRGFTSNGRDSTSTVFDVRTLAAVGTVHVGGRNPDAIVFDRATGRAFTMNAGSGTATAVDARGMSVAGTIPLGGRPEFAVVDGRGNLYVNLEDSSAIAVVDTRALRVVRHFALTGCESPSGLAFDAAEGRLFSVCENRVMAVSDAATGRVIATVPIGEGTDGAGYDERRHTAFSSNGGDGTLSVVRETSPGHYAAVQTVPTRRGARTMAVDPRNGRVYTVSAEFGPAPAPTAENPRPRRTIVPGSFTVIEVSPAGA